MTLPESLYITALTNIILYYSSDRFEAFLLELPQIVIGRISFALWNTTAPNDFPQNAKSFTSHNRQRNHNLPITGTH